MKSAEVDRMKRDDYLGKILDEYKERGFKHAIGSLFFDLKNRHYFILYGNHLKGLQENIED